MHFEFESILRDSSKRIAEETRFGKMEAALELKIAKIRNAFSKMEVLANSGTPDTMAKLSVLFVLNKPTIAHDILEAKNQLLELRIETEANSEQINSRSIADRKIENNLLKIMEDDLATLESKLTSGEILSGFNLHPF